MICFVLIVYINVATLLLSRAVSNAEEVVLQLALGVVYKRIMAQILSQCLWLTLVGMVVGILFSKIFVDTLGYLFYVVVSILTIWFTFYVLLFIGLVLFVSLLICSIALGFSLFFKS